MQTNHDISAAVKNCEDEAIHLIESVQSFGYVIAIDPNTKKIQVFSENINELFKVDIVAGETLITELIDIPSPEAPTFQTIYDSVKGGNVRHAYQWQFGENRSLPISEVFKDPDLFGGKEDRIPWVEKAFRNAESK